jgi:hypothetical protein
MASKYRDFELEIWRDSNGYMAEVKDSPAGKSARVRVPWKVRDEKDHELLLVKLENTILKGRGGFRNASVEEKVLQEFGAEVFRNIFVLAPEIPDLYAESMRKVEEDPEVDGLRVKLRTDAPEISVLPWEFAFDNADFICLKNKPVVRSLEKGKPAPVSQVKGTLRVLGMIANPGTTEFPLLDAEAERRAIDESFRRLPARHVEFRWVGGTYDDLFEEMQAGPWHILHFIGHGGIELRRDETGEERPVGFLVMEGKPDAEGRPGEPRKVYANELGLALDERSLRLAVLNCCDSGKSASSVGASLVREGIPAAVAMQYPITDAAASRFSGMFYSSLARGKPVETALTIARRFIRANSNVEWAIPVLFTRSEAGALVERGGDPEPQPQHREPAPPTQRAEAVDAVRKLWARK